MRSPLTSRSEDFDGQTPLLFRAADMLRLEGVVAAVTQDGMSLALVSRHEAILDHYGKILVERLRAVAPEIGIEIYFPASADALLARFNSPAGHGSQCAHRAAQNLGRARRLGAARP